MTEYNVHYIYVDSGGTTHSDQTINVFAQNQNEAFIIAAGKLFAFFNNTTDKLRGFTISEVSS